jgi:hypothetical protein
MSLVYFGRSEDLAYGQSIGRIVEALSFGCLSVVPAQFGNGLVIRFPNHSGVIVVVGIWLSVMQYQDLPSFG